MTRRQVLNTTSIKKRDNMQPVLVTDDLSAQSPGPVTMTGDNLYGFLFSPSARRAKLNDSQYVRNASNTFCKGYAEKCVFESNGGSDWLWRRICFTTKDPTVQASFPAFTLDLESTTNGQMRTLWNFLNGSTDANFAATTLDSLIFQGVKGVDWTDRFNARLNPRFITPITDRTRTLTGNSGHGHFFSHKNWWGINKRIQYRDHEDGSETGYKAEEPWSTNGKPGVGNLFVLDFFAEAAGQAADEIIYLPHGTYYWHER